MKKLTAIGIAALACVSFLGACNDSDYDSGEASPTGVAVYSFSIQANDKIMSNLDSVFFSIDLVSARIFNADSLPFGTKTDKLVPSISMYDNISALELIVPRENGTDTIHNYLTHPGDSIDFSNGPVGMRVVSADGLVERLYSITVNVHTLKSDSLVWDMAARRPLPGSIASPTEQHTTSNAAAVYTLTRANSSYSIAYTDNPFDGTWTGISPVLPEGAIVNSFTADNNKLYILADDNISVNNHALYSSSDNGNTWTPEGIRLTTIYGSCNGKIQANIHNDNDVWELADIYTGARSAMPEGMPAERTSNPTLYTPPMSSGEQMILIGGIDANGAKVSSTWTYDGTAWARVSAYNLKWAEPEMVLVPFVTFRISGSFNVTSYPTLIAFGGRQDSGEPQRTVYVSPDFGITWQTAPELMQLPAEIPAVYNAQAYVYPGTLHNTSRAAQEWTGLEITRTLPAGAVIGEMPLSRVSRPENEWQCPFIFMFGGKNASGATYPYIWRATFNRLTFKPLI